ncbi:MCE family protein [Nocardioides sp. WS12]|uniref:MCE family protein n=1 Tax=Nocardioides sp. WS12 TaxID=2486272 RepID=UPI0015F9AB66|nr:MCE family protein [Nocardioides sp. WS12]
MTKQSPSDWAKVRAALVGLAGIAVLLAAAVNFQRLPLVGGGETYQAEFTDAAGLVAGEEVRVAGIKVGQVDSIELADTLVLVTFTVKGVDMGDDTTAGIEVKTLLGQHFLRLSPNGHGELAEGSTIPLARTSTPLNIVPAFEQLSGQIQEIDTGQVAEAFDALTETLGATTPETTQTLNGLSRLSLAISSRDEEITELFSRTHQVSGVVADRDKELAELLTGTDDVLQVLADRRAVITAIIRDTRGLAQQISGLVTDNEEGLEKALTQLDAVLEVLKKNRQQIDDTMKYGLSYAREFVSVGGSGRWFDSWVKFPTLATLCAKDSDNDLSALLDTVLTPLNEAATGKSTPCLPLEVPGGTQ